MKKGIVVVGLIIVLLLSLNNYFQINSLKQKIFHLESELAQSAEGEEPEDIELSDIMTKLQRHSNKLWFAGKAGNWPLSAFYIHELEESFEELTEHEVIDEGVNISLLANDMGLEPLDLVEGAIKQQDTAAFQSSYENLLSHCNSCHKSSNHSFIVINKPETPLFDNQEYNITQ